jgi:hypothetical protein
MTSKSRKQRFRKGGRGITAPYLSPPIRCPAPIRAEISALIDLYVRSGFSQYPEYSRDVVAPPDLPPDAADYVRFVFHTLRIQLSPYFREEQDSDPPRALPVDSPIAEGSEGQGSERSGEAKPLPLTLRFIRDFLSKGRGRGVARGGAFRQPLRLVFNSRNP